MSSCLFAQIPLIFTGMCRNVVKAVMKISKQVDKCIALDEDVGECGWFTC